MPKGMGSGQTQMDLHIMLSNEQWLTVMYHALAAAAIGPAFAMLFTVPGRYLTLIALVSALSRGSRDMLVMMNVEVIPATFIACSICSLIFIYFGPRLKVPRPIFTVPCIISMIPGVDAFNALVALMNVAEPESNAVLNDQILVLFHSGMRSIGIIFSIAIGLAIPPLFFYKYRHVKL